MAAPPTRIGAEVAVVGSGAGGAVTAARLAAAGRDVLVLEEGPRYDPDAVEPFSLEELATRYRHRGLSASLGSPAIAFAEGRCVGGSTEVNSGLYHRLPGELVERWARRYAIDEFDEPALDHYAEELEADLGVSRVDGAPPRSSQVLQEGADALGWEKVYEAQYNSVGEASWTPFAQAMQSAGVKGLVYTGEPENLAFLSNAVRHPKAQTLFRRLFYA